MTKFKVGDKVIKPKYPTNVPYVIELATVESGHDTYTLTGGDLGKGSTRHWWMNDDLKLMEKTMENLVQGDVLVSESTYQENLIFQGKVGDIFGFIEDEEDNRSAVWFSKEELDELKYTIKGSEPEQTEVTLAEIADKFGVDVESLRIKDGE